LFISDLIDNLSLKKEIAKIRIIEKRHNWKFGFFLKK